MESELTINENGNKEWTLPNGKLHREDGPAIEYCDGSKEWWVNGNIHREDGPALEWSGGGKNWFLNNIQYTEKDYKYEMRSIKLTKLLK
jgi:hypothetical protein